MPVPRIHAKMKSDATMSDYETLLADAAQLPVYARIRLIDALWSTLPEDVEPPLSNEWRAKIERRSANYDAGLEQPVPWKQVLADAVGQLNVLNEGR
jgi:putative addiction module component (TIGR02574 family)